MYCEFYQLREPPFNVTPDPKFLYLNARYREAIASLNYGITQRKGFITLIGEAGTGKTTLLNKLLEELDTKTKSVFIFNTNVTFEEILEYMFAEFALPVHNGKKLYMLQRLNSFLLEELRGGGNVALLIDEAQDLEFSVLEDLRLLSNLETAKEKILQIVLSGQPELGQKLSNPILRQLRQRIGINCRLLPLSRDEITEYVQYRLQAAGCPDLKLFSREAEEQIYHFSRGIPRLVNVVCDNALVIGYALGKKRIGADVITEAAADLLSVEPPREDVDDRPIEVSAPAPLIAPQSRWRNRLGVIGLVVVAMVLGLLSVGRTVLSKHADERAAAVPATRQLEVIRPGSEPQGVGVELATGGGDDRARPPAEVDAEPAVPNRPGAATAEGANAGRAPEPVVDHRDAAVARPPEGRGPDVGVPGVAKEMPPGGTRPAERGSETQKQVLDERGAASRPPEQVAVAQKVSGQPMVIDNLDPVPAAAQPAKPAAVAAVSIPPVVAKVETVDALPPANPGSPDVAGDDRVDASDPGIEDGPAPRLDGVTFEHVLVRSGDSMSEIAARKYGQASYTILDLLKLANPELTNIDLIAVGQTIRLPELGEGFPILSDGSGHYSLLVFSTPQERRASSFQKVLRGRGLDAHVLAAEGSQRRMYRVVLSGFKDRDEVIATGRQLQRLFRDDTRVAQLGE